VSPDEAKAIQNLEAINRYDPEVTLDNNQIDPEIYAELPQEIKVLRTNLG
jgi:hypothetical protein